MPRTWTEAERAAASEAAKKRHAEQQLAREEAGYTPPEFVEGEIPAAVEIMVPPEPVDDFGRFLATLDAETRDLLGDDDLRTIYADQQKKAREEKRAALKKAVAARAKHHALVAEGLLDEAVVADDARRQFHAERVWHVIDLPELGDIGIRVNQQVYRHGHGYWLTRDLFTDILSMEYQAQQNELLFEGKDRRHWLRRRALGSMENLRDEDGAVRIM